MINVEPLFTRVDPIEPHVKIDNLRQHGLQFTTGDWIADCLAGRILQEQFIIILSFADSPTPSLDTHQLPLHTSSGLYSHETQWLGFINPARTDPGNFDAGFRWWLEIPLPRLPRPMSSQTRQPTINIMSLHRLWHVDRWAVSLTGIGLKVTRRVINAIPLLVRLHCKLPYYI